METIFSDDPALVFMVIVNCFITGDECICNATLGSEKWTSQLKVRRRHGTRGDVGSGGGLESCGSGLSSMRYHVIKRTG